MKIAIVVMIGLVCVLANEFGILFWMQIAPMSLDIGGNYWLLGIGPVVACVVTLQALLLWVIYRTDTFKHAAIFVVVYLVATAFELNTFGNPLADILSYLGVISVVSFMVFWSFYRLAWSRM
jgi:hypothetical protein